MIVEIYFLYKKVIRLIDKTHFLAHTDPLFKNDKILKIGDIFDLQCFKFFYKFINKRLPHKIMKYFQIDRNANTKLILFDCCNGNGKKRIRYSLPHLINTAPPSFTAKAYTHSLQGFKNYIKNTMISSYNNEICIIPNCYSCNFSNRSTNSAATVIA